MFASCRSASPTCRAVRRSSHCSIFHLSHSYTTTATFCFFRTCTASDIMYNLLLRMEVVEAMQFLDGLPLVRGGHASTVRSRLHG